MAAERGGAIAEIGLVAAVRAARRARISRRTKRLALDQHFRAVGFEFHFA